MKAALFERFAGPLSIETVPDPSPPPDGAVIRVEANGVCRSDWHGWMGHDPDIQELPHVPGHECAGVIEAVGPEVRRWRPGDRVIVPVVNGCGRCPQCHRGDHQVCDRQFQPGFTGWGAFAELVAVPYADTNLLALPEDMDVLVGASLGCRFTTAFRVVVQQGRVSAGQWVAVHGCGGVGLSAVMIAEAMGANAIAVDIDEDKLALARDAGARATVNAAETNDVGEAVRALSGGGTQVSVDALGSAVTCRNAILGLRPRGRHVQVGLMMGGAQDAAVPLDRVIAKELEIVGSHAIAAHSFAEIFALVAAGKVAPEKLIKRRVSLAEGARVLEQMGDFPETGVVMIDRF